MRCSHLPGGVLVGAAETSPVSQRQTGISVGHVEVDGAPLPGRAVEDGPRLHVTAGLLRGRRGTLRAAGALTLGPAEVHVPAQLAAV